MSSSTPSSIRLWLADPLASPETSTQSDSPLITLPGELLNHVMEYTRPSDLENFAPTCRALAAPYGADPSLIVSGQAYGRHKLLEPPQDDDSEQDKITKTELRERLLQTVTFIQDSSDEKFMPTGKPSTHTYASWEGFDLPDSTDTVHVVVSQAREVADYRHRFCSTTIGLVPVIMQNSQIKYLSIASSRGAFDGFLMSQYNYPLRHLAPMDCTLVHELKSGRTFRSLKKKEVPISFNRNGASTVVFLLSPDDKGTFEFCGLSNPGILDPSYSELPQPKAEDRLAGLCANIGVMSQFGGGHHIFAGYDLLNKKHFCLPESATDQDIAGFCQTKFLSESNVLAIELMTYNEAVNASLTPQCRGRHPRAESSFT